MKSLLVIIFSLSIYCSNAASQDFFSIGNEKDKFKELVKQGNLYFDSYQFSKAQELYLQALTIKPDDRFIKYKLQDIKTMQELFNIVEKYEKVAELSGVMPKIIEKKVLDETVAENKTEAIVKKMDDNSIENNMFVAEARTEIAANNIIRPVESENIVEPVKIIVKKETTVATQQPEKKMDEKELEEAYKEEQTRLLSKYIVGKTVEDFPAETRTITRTIVRYEDKVSVYLRIKYKWGGVFYYIDDSPRDVIPISEDKYFKLTSVE